MSGLFPVLGISGSGVDAMQTWLTTTGGNIANANDAVSPSKGTYAEETTVLTPAGSPLPGQAGEGVNASVQLGSTTGLLVFQPSNPVANAKGYVRVPSVSLSNELVNLIQAQEGYQANTSAMQKAISAYQSGLAIGN